MRRRPLLRAAAVGGIASMGAKAGTANAMHASQAQAAPVPAPAAGPGAGAGDRTAQLQQLAALHTQGVLTDEELVSEKAQVLAGPR